MKRVRSSVRKGATAKRRTPSRKREKVPIGSSQVNASDLRGLQIAWRRGELVLFLGAGVSIPYGLPSWRDLVLELLFEQAQQTRRLGGMWEHYRRAVASWMTDYFDFDPLVLARMVERDLRERAPEHLARRNAGSSDRFLTGLRTHLYSNERRPRGRTALRAIAELIARNSKTAGVESVVTFNFDDLLERELGRVGAPYHTVSSGERQSGEIRVIHVHGYVPRNGPLSRENMIFTEPDYHRLTESVFHWGLSEVVERLRKKTVLFVGLSMSDPSLRRLLDAGRNSDIPPHWQLAKRHEVRDHELAAAKTEVERRARKHAELLGAGFQQLKDQTELEAVIHNALRQADTYDREVYESMGVKTIWLESFEDIARIIDRIGR